MLIPGAGWAVADAFDGAEPIDVPGATTASYGEFDGRPTAGATDGANLVLVSSNLLQDGTDPAEPTAALASALLAAMN
ncbi:hypothetical protein [Agromyces mangrovi Wang et al. 2018]|uniref:hypothetical protein n=1 Tax=Agromyces mangrovi TaxID=1858653 RepID=UPI0025725582|nr:hypothetical protein [Agromyces mangrovi]BDZ65952.1 hypothetical protein GCM10025877_28900 [Agromyces mangrovi]